MPTHRLIRAEVLGDGDIPVSLGGDGVISGPAFDANGNPIPTPQQLGGLSAHIYPPAVPAHRAVPKKQRRTVQPPPKRGGSAKGLLRAQPAVMTGAAVFRHQGAALVRRELPARAMLADPAAGISAAEDGTRTGSMAVLPATEDTETDADVADEAVGGVDAAVSTGVAGGLSVGGADSGTADVIPTATGAAEPADLSVPVEEKQPLAVVGQGLHADQGALQEPLPGAQPQSRAAKARKAATDTGVAAQQTAGGAGADPIAAGDSAAAKHHTAADTITDAGADVQPATGAGAAGNSVAATGGPAEAVRSAVQAKVCTVQTCADYERVSG